MTPVLAAVRFLFELPPDMTPDELREHLESPQGRRDLKRFYISIPYRVEQTEGVDRWGAKQLRCVEITLHLPDEVEG